MFLIMVYFIIYVFEGFDECHSDDMTSDEEDSETSSLNDFINDEEFRYYRQYR